MIILANIIMFTKIIFGGHLKEVNVWKTNFVSRFLFVIDIYEPVCLRRSFLDLMNLIYLLYIYIYRLLYHFEICYLWFTFFSKERACFNFSQ